MNNIIKIILTMVTIFSFCLGVGFVFLGDYTKGNTFITLTLAYYMILKEFNKYVETVE